MPYTRNHPFLHHLYSHTENTASHSYALRIPPHIVTHWEYRLTLLRTENTASHFPHRHYCQPQLVLTKDDLVSPKVTTTCCFPLQVSPGATNTIQYSPLPSALNMQSSEKGLRPMWCLFLQQVVYLQNQHISDTKINICVFPQLSPCLHPSRHVSSTKLLS